MNIAIHAPSSAYPKIRKLAQLFHSWGADHEVFKKHQHTVYCTDTKEIDFRRLFDGLPVKFDIGLPKTLRYPPMSSNEPFNYIASKETSGYWFFLGIETVPLHPGWVDRLESERLMFDKPYLGAAAYSPREWIDPAGNKRLSHGNPYILEAAVYPYDFLKRLKSRILSTTSHHEIIHGTEVYNSAQLSDCIQSAEYNFNFRKANCLKSTVVVTRLGNDALIDELLGEEVPLPATVIERVEVPVSAPTPAPIKIPTIKVLTAEEKEQMKKDLETAKTPDTPPADDENHSPFPVSEITLPVKRKPGRPAKSSA